LNTKPRRISSIQINELFFNLYKNTKKNYTRKVKWIDGVNKS
jgi:hypothetical protein